MSATARPLRDRGLLDVELVRVIEPQFKRAGSEVGNELHSGLLRGLAASSLELAAAPTREPSGANAYGVRTRARSEPQETV